VRSPFALLVLLCVVNVSASAQEEPQPGGARETVLRVAVKDSAPFSMKDANGDWTGISVDLWEKVAEERGWEYEYVETTLAEMLEGIRNGEFDVAAAPLTITAERESYLDFSTPYWEEGLVVATIKGTSKTSVLVAAGRKLGLGLAILVGILVLVGGLYYALEAPESVVKGPRGLFHGMYWALTVWTTVGFGDISPKTDKGKLFTMVWMVVAALSFGWIIGQFSAAAALSTVRWDVEDVSELRSYTVATVKGSVAESYLSSSHVRTHEVRTVPELVDTLLDPGSPVDCIVYDQSILLYMLKDKPSVTLSRRVFDKQSYGLALPTDSPIREDVNLAILGQTNTEWWENTVFRHLNH